MVFNRTIELSWQNVEVLWCFPPKSSKQDGNHAGYYVSRFLFSFFSSVSLKDTKTIAVPQQLQQNLSCHVSFRTPSDMLEKLAEQNYSQNQLRDLNSKMRHWLDAADDELVVLRSENTHLRKQVHV